MGGPPGVSSPTYPLIYISSNSHAQSQAVPLPSNLPFRVVSLQASRCLGLWLYSTFNNENLFSALVQWKKDGWKPNSPAEGTRNIALDPLENSTGK